MCVEETNMKAVEFFLERAFSRARKDISGRGAINTRVRIMDNVVFVKMKMDYSGMEKNMFKFISRNSEQENYYNSVREQSRERAQKIMNEIHPVNIKTINFRIDIENEYAFALIVLDKDLENLIRNGTVERPNQMPDDPHNL